MSDSCSWWHAEVAAGLADYLILYIYSHAGRPYRRAEAEVLRTYKVLQVEPYPLTLTTMQ